MLVLGRRQNMTGWKVNGLELNSQLTRWFVSFAELSCLCRGATLCQNVGTPLKVGTGQNIWQTTYIRSISGKLESATSARPPI